VGKSATVSHGGVIGGGDEQLGVLATTKKFKLPPLKQTTRTALLSCVTTTRAHNGQQQQQPQQNQQQQQQQQQQQHAHHVWAANRHCEEEPKRPRRLPLLAILTTLTNRKKFVRSGLEVRRWCNAKSTKRASKKLPRDSHNGKCGEHASKAVPEGSSAMQIRLGDRIS